MLQRVCALALVYDVRIAHPCITLQYVREQWVHQLAAFNIKLADDIAASDIDSVALEQCLLLSEFGGPGL